MDTNKFDPTKYGAKPVATFDPVKMGAKPVTETSLDGFANATPGYFQRVGEQYKQAGESIVGGIKQGAEMINKGNLLGGVRAGLRTVGGVAGAAFAPILEAPVIKPLTEKAVERATQIPGVNEFVSGASNLAKKYPNASADIKNIIDIATLGGGKAVEAPLAKEIGLIGKDVVSGTKFVFTPSEASIQNKVVDLFNKSIKPTAKKTIGQGDKYENDVLNALKTIKNNANDLNIEDATGEIVSRTPQTIQELAQGVDQTKKLVFTQYDNLAKQAGTQGAVIEAMPIADEVAKVAQNKALQLTNPEVIKYAENWSDRLRAMGTLDTETTQEVVKLMNNNLQSFYRNPTYDTASKVAVDAGIANNFRAALDKAIEGATGKEYQALKNQYSALKAIENDVVRASMRDARKNVKGLLDYTDMFTGGQMIGGILSLNPAMFTKGAIERGFKEYIKFLNDPNRAISNIFEKLNTKTAQPFKPQSSTGQYLKNPKLGMSIEDVTKSNPLIQEARKYKSAEEFVNGQTNVYHGSPIKDISEFKIGQRSGTEGSLGEGLYFTNDLKTAKQFAGADGSGVIKKGTVHKVRVELKNPYIVDETGGLTIYDQLDTLMEPKELTAYLKEQGYDGIIAKMEKGKEEIVVFNPSQVKTKSQLTDIWNKANKK